VMEDYLARQFLPAKGRATRGWSATSARPDPMLGS
jgi:hypothetical protein